MIAAESRLLAALLVCIGLVGCKKGPPPAQPPPEVGDEPVDVRDMPVQGEFPRQVRGGEGVDVRAQVTGFLQTQDYREGSLVRKGEVLFNIDLRPLQAAFRRAQADMAEAE